MARLKIHREGHLVSRIGWLRAAVLGANDGTVSTASLIVGVAAAGAGRWQVLLSGAAGLVAGAMSMAAGEYVSVSSQSDSERADLARERRELRELPDQELAELTSIYAGRGLEPELAREVAIKLTANDALGAHARDELGLSEVTAARPLQAALASAAAFSAGAVLPMLAVFAAPVALLIPIVSIASLLILAVLGAVGARAGGAAMLRPTLRVAFWGALAMAVTALIGSFFGTVAE
jgi:VIT1/CCC1 family predicted Fe2+/Mn2+ transporter